MIRIELFTGPNVTADLRDYLNQLIILLNSGELLPTWLQIFAREKLVTSQAEAIVAAPFTQYVVNMAVPGPVTFDLPDVDDWLETYNSALPIIFKDLSGGATAVNFIQVSAHFGQTIDGQASWQIQAPYGALAIRPRDDGAGWWVT